MSDRGTLEKLLIQAYTTPDYSGQATEVFESYVNPSEINLSYEVEYDSSQGSGTTNSRMEFKKMKPGDLTLNFFIDGTGANGRKADVQQVIEKFQLVTGYNGDIHRTNYLIIVWGTLQVRKCVLKSASIVYKMFKPDGVPLRAVINAVFTDNSDDQSRVALAQDQSPDLTHVRQVIAGSSLPGMCTEIYGNPSYYLDVAKANNIDDFRNLVPGTRIFFPPLEK
ncbi:MAG: hypothetical protein HXX13_17510 [Bacteroidetes bacterium]|nr:hypothetical protein [Bacteroidota bacterium]